MHNLSVFHQREGRRKIRKIKGENIHVFSTLKTSVTLPLPLTFDNVNKTMTTPSSAPHPSPLPLVQIFDVPGKIVLDIAYATPQNFTGAKVYEHPHCYLHREAYEKLMVALDLALQQGYALRLFDAFRPQEAQEKLWAHTPDATYICPPERGSSHSRGVAIDLTLIDLNTGKDLEMGTPFDDFTPLSHHGAAGLSLEAQRNRYVLLGIMTTAGFDFYQFEWWHYQLFKARETYPILYDRDLEISMMR